MSPISRRTLIGSAAAVGTGAALGVMPLRASRAQAATTGTITDVKHVVILMQENRSFDHYFGTLQGVRGFGDRSAVEISGGNSIFNQPNGSGRQYPWNLSNGSGDGFASAETLAQCDGSLDHSWSTQHEAWDGGKMDAWVSAKGSDRTMGYLTRSDVPFHYALADAYTICDAYHCSILSATGPNRTYLWSGMIDPNGTAGGPAYDGGSESGLRWQTYAEALQDAGVSWKVYQVASDNFGDNALAYFNQFANASTSSPLYINGMSSVPSATGSTPTDIAAAIKNDVVNGTLSQVSWIVANQQCSEHPDAPPEDGAQFVNEVLQALAADSAVFNSTVLFLNYDENDGFFDHVPPPIPPAGTAGEFIQSGTPIGLGFRVPMLVASPWTRGGWVDSQTYDHTSVIRFLETWTAALGTPAACTNISGWRREICGDLTGAFDFANPVYGLPANLPGTSSTISQSLCDIEINPWAQTNSLPTQESGSRHARALPYQPDGYVSSLKFGSNGQILLWLKMANEGRLATGAATFAVYANKFRSGGPWQYTVPAYSSSAGDGVVTDFFNIGSGYGNGAYDLTMTGPNRFLRRFEGHANTAGRYVEVTSRYAPSPNLGEEAFWLTMRNTSSSQAATFTVTSNHYRGDGPWMYEVAPGSTVSDYWNQGAYCNGWYDFTVTVSTDSSWSRRFTGHIETGSASVTG